MTSRQRLWAAMHCETVDRIPVSPQDCGAVDLNSKLGQRLLHETDMHLYASGYFDWFGGGVPIEHHRKGDRHTTVWHSLAGDFTSAVRVTEKTTGRIVHCCQTPEDGERWLDTSFVPDAGAINQALVEFRARCEAVGEESLVMVAIGDGICLPADLYSPEDFCLLWADAPDVMEMLVEEGARRIQLMVEQWLAGGVDAFRIIGPEYASTQLGPTAYERLVVPFDKDLVAQIKQAGAIAYLHNHGPIMNYLPMIREIAPHALDPLEAPPWGDFDPVRARALLGDEICMVGNLDDMEIMGKRPFEEISGMAQGLMDAMGDRGFILSGTTSGTYNERAAEQFIRLAKMIRGQ
ncbi:MAG: uroporphyrinogen decarboxylase family protein [Candidatus Latescibacterota bacterium]